MQSLVCPHCGSGSFSEVSNNNYRCNYCNSDFTIFRESTDANEDKNKIKIHYSANPQDYKDSNFAEYNLKEIESLKKRIPKETSDKKIRKMKEKIEKCEILLTKMFKGEPLF